MKLFYEIIEFLYQLYNMHVFANKVVIKVRKINVDGQNLCKLTEKLPFIMINEKVKLKLRRISVATNSNHKLLQKLFHFATKYQDPLRA